MKKILILLIGFAFTQSIQTKQVEVTINEWGDYNPSGADSKKVVDLSNYLNLEYGAYLVEIAHFEILSPDFTGFFKLELENCYGDISAGADIRKVEILTEYFPNDEPQIQVLYPDSKLRLNNGCTTIYTDNMPLVYAEMNGIDYFPLKFTFHVTGMFEDEGVGLQGDMNDDEVINVTDIIALVNIIIGD